jgi:hypothetical protein
MAGPTHGRINLAAFLAVKVRELRVRKGPHSVIVQTLEAALTSGTEVDLHRGKLAFEIWQQTGDQKRLVEIPRPLPPTPIPSTPPREQQVEQIQLRVKVGETTVAAPKRRRFKGNFSSSSSEGIDFSKPDRLSTSKLRHLLASRKRPKPRLKPRPKPRGK